MNRTRSCIALVAAAVGLASVVAIAYAPGMSGGFYFDDLSNFVESEVLHWTELEFER